METVVDLIEELIIDRKDTLAKCIEHYNKLAEMTKLRDDLAKSCRLHYDFLDEKGLRKEYENFVKEKEIRE